MNDVALMYLGAHHYRVDYTDYKGRSAGPEFHSITDVGLDCDHVA